MTYDEFAQALGFSDYEALGRASEVIITEGDIYWFVTRLPDGRWAAWDDAEIALDRCEIFPTCEEAVRHHVHAYLDASANWEEEVDPSWDSSGTIAVSWSTTVTVDGVEYSVRVDEFEPENVPEGIGGYAYTVTYGDDGNYLPGGENMDAASRFDAETQAAALIAREVAKSIARDRA